MAKIDFSTEMLDLNAEVIKFPENGEQKVLTLKKVAIEALQGVFEDEKSLSQEEKLKRFFLANDISKAKEPIEITSEQIVLIKQLVNKAYSTLVVGRVHQLLEGKSQE